MHQTLIAGDTLDFTLSVPDYPASAGWALTFKLIPRTSGTVYTITATADGDDYEATAAAATTAAWTPGEFSWAAYVTLGAESYTVEGWVSHDGLYAGGSDITLKANPRTATTYDNRSIARKVLDGLMALHQSNSVGSGLISEYSIAGRSMRFRDPADLVTQIDYWRRQVALEDRAERLRAGLDSGSTLRVRF